MFNGFSPSLSIFRREKPLIFKEIYISSLFRSLVYWKKGAAVSSLWRVVLFVASNFSLV
jgi:hypothetical protein